MSRPQFVDEYDSFAHELIRNHAVSEPIFSRGTYQIAVTENEVTEFPLLQLSDSGEVLDALCTCKSSEKRGECAHLAAAYLVIMNDTPNPLHVRFQSSLWNRLFQMVSKRHESEEQCQIKMQNNAFSCVSSKTNKRLFHIQAKTKESQKRLQQILDDRSLTIDETSIKFSNLSLEEMREWREKRPSPLLQYELSFWSDLAKWIFWRIDQKEKYSITYRHTSDQPPSEMRVALKDLSLFFYIATVSWPWLIPALPTVESPLSILDATSKQLGQIHYDPNTRALTITPQKTQQQKALHEPGTPIGDWIYVKNRGFYRKTIGSFSKIQILSGDAIGPFLTQSMKELHELTDTPIHQGSIKARSTLFIDNSGDFHIELFVFQPNDLEKPLSATFLPWIYLPKTDEHHGFWLIEDWPFTESNFIIPQKEVGDFVNRNRHWLHQFVHFQTHLGSLESHLTYSFNAQGSLVFHAELDYPDISQGAIDYGEWVYLRGQGFYKKKQSRSQLPIHPNLIIEKEKISAFIASHKDELDAVHSFFAPQSPIVKLGLSIRVNENNLIAIDPQYEFATGVDPKKVRFYGDYVYTEPIGFSELPPQARLPEGYRSPTIISSYQEPTFITYELELLKNFCLYIDPRLTSASHLHLKIRRIVKSRKRMFSEWLIDAVYISDTGFVDLISLWEAIQNKKSHLFSPAGMIFLKDNRFQWIFQLNKSKIDLKHRAIRLSLMEWIRLSAFETIVPPNKEDPDFEETRRLLDDLDRLESHNPLDIKLLQATLRPYQEAGVQWLWFLYCHGLSGLLCDDMGLGKTHQAMSLLAAILAGDEERSNKYLVVCPTSVIYHWQELLHRFLPHIRVTVFHGFSRSLDNFAETSDLILTSYGVLRSSLDQLKSISFEMAIFDEMQIAKNHHSQTHRALRSISARMRLGLTGTPIENRLRELKSLFDIILPGYFPSEALFRDLFVQPIEKDSNEQQKLLLHRLVKPFVLRRKKSEVLTDLPEKIEEIAYCDLSEEQQTLYHNVALQMRNTVYQELIDESKPIPYLHVFSALSTLKQICDHPSLHLKDPKSFSSHSSGKWDLFVELIQEALDSDQKIVVFSQYLDMLSIIESFLKKRGVGFAGITGSTRDRAEPIRRFRADPNCRVFVASLLAAGIGIDLTVASVVIHYDRWWNPAKENQATDRVHRIGQNRGVQVFKLVTKNTIEEHIHSIIERKKSLLEILGPSENDQISYLNREELISVFNTIWSNSNPPT